MGLFDWIKRAARGGYARVEMTLATGQQIEAGNLTISAAGDGQIMVEVGGRFAAIITGAPTRRYHVICHTDGRRLLRRTRTPVGPLLILGPGGDYRDERYSDHIGGDPETDPPKAEQISQIAQRETGKT